jgi:hypothetical protein
MGPSLRGEQEEGDEQGVERLRFDEGEPREHQALHQRQRLGLARGRLDALAEDDPDADAGTECAQPDGQTSAEFGQRLPC